MTPDGIGRAKFRGSAARLRIDHGVPQTLRQIIAELQHIERMRALLGARHAATLREVDFYQSFGAEGSLLEG